MVKYLQKKIRVCRIGKGKIHIMDIMEFLEKMLGSLLSGLLNIGKEILFAGLVFVAGIVVVRLAGKFMQKNKVFKKLDPSVQSFTRSLVKIVIWTLVIVSVVAILGVPVSSLIAAISAAGLAIGLALQGALSNFAGGLMILIFKPFGVGDYISATGAEGTVSDITVFYTKLITVDNKRITVPNGSLMNANVVNYSSEATRRVDIPVTVAYGTDAGTVREIMLAAAADQRVLAEPEAVVVQTNATETGREFTLRVWCSGADYWDLKFDVTDRVFAGFAEKGIQPATARISVVSENR